MKKLTYILFFFLFTALYSNAQFGSILGSISNGFKKAANYINTANSGLKIAAQVTKIPLDIQEMTSRTNQLIQSTNQIKNYMATTKISSTDKKIILEMLNSQVNNLVTLSSGIAQNFTDISATLSSYASALATSSANVDVVQQINTIEQTLEKISKTKQAYMQTLNQCQSINNQIVNLIQTLDGGNSFINSFRKNF